MKEDLFEEDSKSMLPTLLSLEKRLRVFANANLRAWRKASRSAKGLLCSPAEVFLLGVEVEEADDAESSSSFW